MKRRHKEKGYTGMGNKKEKYRDEKLMEKRYLRRRKHDQGKYKEEIQRIERAI